MASTGPDQPATPPPAGLRVVRAEGDAMTRGRHVGRTLGDLIERSIGFYHDYFERRAGEGQDIQELLAPYLAAADRDLPDLMASVRGMAEGAMVPVWELFAVNTFEELDPLLASGDGTPGFLARKEGEARRPDDDPLAGLSGQFDRCSTFTVVGPGVTLLGHNEHWLAGDAGNVAVVIDVPQDDPPVVSPTVVCCLPAVGMNARGGAQGIQSLRASDDGPGVPRVLVSRNSLGASERLDAIGRASLENRAGGYGHVFAFRGGDAFMVETTRTRHSVLEGPGPHTNHYLDPALGELGPDPSDSSLTRYDRLLDLLEERHPQDPHAVMDVLRDHKGGPNAICLHPSLAEGEEASAVVYSMVCDLEAGRMWVAPGNPCRTEYEEIDLSGVV